MSDNKIKMIFIDNSFLGQRLYAGVILQPKLECLVIVFLTVFLISEAGEHLLLFVYLIPIHL